MNGSLTSIKKIVDDLNNANLDGKTGQSVFLALSCLYCASLTSSNDLN